MRPKDRDTLFAGAGLIFIAVYVGLLGVAIFIAYHFITKFW